MSLLNELIIERDLALKNGDFEEFSKLCLILAITTFEEVENTTEKMRKTCKK